MDEDADAKMILTAPYQKTGRDHQGVLVSRGNCCCCSYYYYYYYYCCYYYIRLTAFWCKPAPGR